MTRQVSEERKAAYYLGSVLIGVGLLLFLSVFVTAAMNFGDFDDFETRSSNEMFRAIAGMALIFVGKIVRGIGARGLAGSGVVLDPERARRELEPYSRMAGGMVKDALQEAQVGSGGPQRVVMVKCGACAQLNDEDAQFCKACGKAL